MIIRKLTLVSVALLFSLPTAAEASDINVEAGQVRVNTTVDGSINVQSGQNRVNVNSPTLPLRVNSSPNPKLSNCSTRTRTRTRRANCRQSTTVHRNSSNTSTTTIVVEPPLKQPSSRIETTQRSGCRGDGSYSSQRVSQTNNSSEVVVHSSVTTNACR